MTSRQSKDLVGLYASVAERLSKPGTDLATMRDIVETLHLASTEPEGVAYAETDAGGVQALWCIPEGCDANSVLLYIHGGGSVLFSMHSDRKAAGHIAKAVGVRALVLNYRRSPEHPFPAQPDDVETAYRWLLDQGVRPEDIALVGHSIGGALAVRLAVTLREKGVPQPAAILAVSPWCDMEMKNETLNSHAATDALLSKQILEMFRAAWIGGARLAHDDPRVNLLHADLTGLPPLMIYYGADEILAGEAVELATRAKDFGVDVRLHPLREGQHSFILGAGRVPEVDEAISVMARWLRSHLEPRTTRRSDEIRSNRGAGADTSSAETGAGPVSRLAGAMLVSAIRSPFAPRRGS